jgi:hypothetical protein
MQSDEKISPEDEDDDPMELDSPVMASQLPVRSGKSSILGPLSRVPRIATGFHEQLVRTTVTVPQSVIPTFLKFLAQ